MPFHDDWIRFSQLGAEENRRRRWRALGQQRDLVPVMNNTKWRKLRAAMLDLRPFSPSYRILNAEYGKLTEWDGEWFYHFNVPTYAFIERLDLRPYSPQMRGVLHEALIRLHLPGEETPRLQHIWIQPRGTTARLHSVTSY